MKKKLCVKKLFFTPKGKKNDTFKFIQRNVHAEELNYPRSPHATQFFFPKPTFLLNFCASKSLAQFYYLRNNLFFLSPLRCGFNYYDVCPEESYVAKKNHLTLMKGYK